MRWPRVSTQPTDARGHVARVATVRAICMKYSSQPGRMRVLGNVETRGELAHAIAQAFDLFAGFDIGQRVANDPRNLATLFGAETPRRNRRRAQANAAGDERLLLVERNRVLVHRYVDLVEILFDRFAGEVFHRHVDEHEMRI